MHTPGCAVLVLDVVSAMCAAPGHLGGIERGRVAATRGGVEETKVQTSSNKI